MYQASFVPLVFTLLLHGLMIAMLVVGFEGKSKLQTVRPLPDFVKAKLVVLEKPKAEKKAPVKKAAPKPQVKEKPKAKPKPKPAAKTETKPKPVPKVEEKNSAEQAREELARAIAAEEAMMAAEEEAVQVASYVSIIGAQVERNWSRPPSARNGMETELQITLYPTGEVAGVSIVRSSGNSAFDRSAERAVHKAGYFPELAGLEPAFFERYFRQFRLLFKPEDLRQ